jgi:radical SAM superfamily enzyme YgiQ (UPF0313 family)
LPSRNILLLYPPYEYAISRYQQGNYTALHAPPLGLGYIANTLKLNGFEVAIVNMALEGMLVEEVASLLDQYQPFLVGISGHMAFFISQSLALAEHIKSYDRDIVTVMGGNQATYLSNDILTEHSAVDYVVVGEGELTLLELAQFVLASKSPNGVAPAGVVYRNQNGVHFQPRQILHNIDLLGMPDRNILKVRDYPKLSKGILTTSRGCPHRCKFCSTASVFGRNVRRHSVEHVLEELQELVCDFGIDTVSFVDDSFLSDKNWVKTLFQNIKEQELKLKWGCGARGDQLDEIVLQKMIETGCTSIFFGLESATQDVIDATGKRLRLDRAVRNIIRARDAGVQIYTSFILGLPGETAESLTKITELIEEIRPHEIFLNILAVYPGTPYYDDPAGHGFLWVEKDWSKFEKFYPMVETRTLSREELLHGYIDIVMGLQESYKEGRLIPGRRDEVLR